MCITLTFLCSFCLEMHSFGAVCRDFVPLLIIIITNNDTRATTSAIIIIIIIITMTMFMVLSS